MQANANQTNKTGLQEENIQFIDVYNVVLVFFSDSRK